MSELGFKSWGKLNNNDDRGGDGNGCEDDDEEVTSVYVTKACK
jgi:hypothetical protein